MDEEKSPPRKPRKYIANPVFERWLIEWYIAARDSGNPAQYTIARAYKSLTKCPLRFETGKECFLLEHFTEKLCELIDRKIQKQKGQVHVQQNRHETSVGELDNGKKNAAVYIASPKEVPLLLLENKSQSVIILKALYEAKQSSLPDFITIRQLQALVSDICKDSLDADDSLQWFGSVLSDLITHKFVSKMNCPVRYGLTELGEFVIETQGKEKSKAKEASAKRIEEEKLKKRKEEEKLKKRKEEEKLKKRKEEELLTKKKDEKEKLKRKKDEEEHSKRRNEEATLKKRKEDKKDGGGKSNRTESTSEIVNPDRFILNPYSFDKIQRW